MEAVDNMFWRLMEPKVRAILQYNRDAFHVMPSVSLDHLVNNVMKGLLSTDNIIFVHVPTVNAPEWPPEVRKQFNRDVANAHMWKDCGP